MGGGQQLETERVRLDLSGQQNVCRGGCGASVRSPGERRRLAALAALRRAKRASPCRCAAASGAASEERHAADLTDAESGKLGFTYLIYATQVGLPGVLTCGASSRAAEVTRLQDESHDVFDGSPAPRTASKLPGDNTVKLL